MLIASLPELPSQQHHAVAIVSPLPIRPLYSSRNANVDGTVAKEQDDARSELLEIMAPGSQRKNDIIDHPPSPVYRTLNPLPHDNSFIHAAAAFLTVQNAMAAVAAAAAANDSNTEILEVPPRPRSYSVGDDRSKVPAVVC